MSSIGNSPVNGDDVEDWWARFLESDHENDVRTGLISSDRKRMYLFAQFDRDVPGSGPLVRGTADLASANAATVEKIVCPVITTAAETPEYAAQETAFTAFAHCYVRRRNELISVPFSQVPGKAKSGAEPYYDGLWFALQAADLQDGDRIELGAHGVRGFIAQAIWHVKK